MSGYIGCLGLIGLVVFIALLFVRRKKIEKDMTGFYQEQSLFTTEDMPPTVRESLGASDNLYCCQANLMTATGANVEFWWWEWYVKSNTMVNNVSSVSYAYYLAVSFAPNTVSDEFVQKALAWANKNNRDFGQKFKDFFVLNTQMPYRAEKLADGSLIICWHVLKQRDNYDTKIAWLKNNISLKITPEIALLEEIHALLPPVESKIIEPLPMQAEISGTAFYKHDNYATLRHTFNASWTNLDLELHHISDKFYHEGYDEIEGDWSLKNAGGINELVFALTDETTANEAETLFEKHFGVRARILREDLSVEGHETLAYCNNPFRLPLNVYTYSEFKRRFTERWTNLGIELYDTAPHEGGLWTNSKEFADNFEMKNLKNADQAYLHDYIYISDWGNLLKNVQVAAAIRNDKINVYCEGNLRNERLKDFQGLEKV